MLIQSRVFSPVYYPIPLIFLTPTATNNNQPTAVAGDPKPTSNATAPELDAAQTGEKLDAQLDPTDGELCCSFFCVHSLMIHANNSNLTHPFLDACSSLQSPLVVVAKSPPAKKRAAAVKRPPAKKKTVTKKKTTTKKKKEAPPNNDEPSTPRTIFHWNDVPDNWFCSLKCC